MQPIRIIINFVDIEAASLEDLYLSREVLKLVDKGYQDDEVSTPDWVLDRLSAITSEINVRNRAELQKRLKMAKARRESLATIDEKRTKLDVEITSLEDKLK